MVRRPKSKLPNLGTTIFTEMTALATRHSALNLAQGFPDLPPPEGLVDAAVKALHDGIHQYAPWQVEWGCENGFAITILNSSVPTTVPKPNAP